MKFVAKTIVFAISTIAIGGYARPTVYPALPDVMHADTEVVTNVPFAAWEHGLREFGYILEFAGSASNNIELAFGTDANSDGELSDGETDVVVSWDCGEWAILNNATGERNTAVANIGAHMFSCFFLMHSSGMILDASFRDNETFVFSDLAIAKPDWLYSTEWNMIRLVGRGENIHCGERFSVQVKPSAVIFRLR